MSRTRERCQRNKHQDEEKDTEDKFLSAAFHHEDSDHGIEDCDDQEEESLEIEVRLVWHLDGWTGVLVAEEPPAIRQIKSLLDVSTREGEVMDLDRWRNNDLDRIYPREQENGP